MPRILAPLFILICAVFSINAAQATSLSTEHPNYSPREDISVEIEWTQAPPSAWQLVLVPESTPFASIGMDLFTSYIWMSSPYSGNKSELVISLPRDLALGTYDLWLVDIPPPTSADQDPFTSPVVVLASTSFALEVPLEPFDPLEALAEILVSEGDPQSNAITPVRYTTDPDVIAEWQDFLKASFDLSDADWEQLIETFFGTGADRRYDRWAEFPAFVDTRAISHVRSEQIAKQTEGITQLFLIPSALVEGIQTGYAKTRLSPGLGEPYQSDFLIYALEQLNSPAFRDRVSSEAQRLLQSPADDLIPTVRNWQTGDYRVRCTYTEVLERMKAADPRFELTWNMYMGSPTSIPVGNMTSSGMSTGPTGGGIAFKRMRLHRAVLEAMEACEKSIH